MDEHDTPDHDQANHFSGNDAQDRIHAALTHLSSILQRDGDPYWKGNSASQKPLLKEWAESLDLSIDPESILPQLVRGGQEHDLFENPDTQRIFKVTRKDTFGLEPGIDLALVAEGEDARRLHLWEASPYFYLQRLYLQNQLLPELNTLEGIIVQDLEDEIFELAIVTSQPRFDIIPVTESEIDAWFATLGFKRIASASYYRAADNLGIFDAHDKNVLRSHLYPDILIPFDVIPCHPEAGFLDFIQTAITENLTLHSVRSTHTTDR